MKQIIIIFSIAIGLTNWVFAQNFISENKLWSNVSYGTEYGAPFNSSFIKISGDTIISEIRYSKVFCSTDSIMKNWNYYGGIRETDTGTVYFLEQNKITEFLIIDIGVIDGDSIALNDSYQPYIHVDSVRIIPFGIYNEPRKHVYIKEMYSNYPFWIEGVGCWFGLLYNPAELMMVGEVNNLVCFYENDSLKYHNNYYENCFPTGIHSSIDKNQIIQDPIRVLYKPGSILIQIQENVGPSKCFISDILGKETIIMNLQKTNSLEIHKEELPEGFYIFVLTSNQGIYSKKFVIY